MKNWNPVLVSVIAACCVGPVLADEAELRDELLRLRERVQVLENGNTAADGERFRFGGLVEVEAFSGKSHDGGPTESDVSLATVEVWAEARINDWTTAQLVFLFEEDDTEPMELDQGIVTFGNADLSPIYLTAGRMYVPFGRFESNMVSDPLTLELGETRETALQVGFDNGGLYGSAYTFNGDVDDGGTADALEHYGANLGYRWEAGASGLDVGVSYLTNLADSDGLQEPVAAVDDRIPGVGVYAIYTAGPWSLIGEYVGATRKFDAAELGFDGDGAQPTAWNLEVGYGFALGGRDASVGIAHQRSSEAVDLGLPETKSLVTLSVAVMDNAAVSLEYAGADDYGTSDGGSGKNGSTITLQLAAEF